MLTRTNTVNSISADLVVRVVLALPFDINILPELVDGLLRVFEGSDRFPPVESHVSSVEQTDVGKTYMSSLGSSWPFH